MIRLRDLIKKVRSAKTAADERAILAKEAALIRTAFKEEDNQYRHRNIAKLLFMQLVGHPVQWAQMECLKLIASPKFTEKRIGYLSLSLLIDDSVDVLTLVTNSVSMDLNSKVPYVTGLALTLLGNIGSKEMLRDLSVQVQKLLTKSNPYIRKKAALCCVRMFKKVPDLVEDFVGGLSALLTHKSHSVIMTGVTLITEVAINHPKYIKKLRKTVPRLLKVLKGLLQSSYFPEHDVAGITDPFLQTRILKLLGVLGKDDEQTSELMSDILAKVATSTESAKNTGNTIIYECVRTILKIDAEDNLRVLAINVLGKFLSSSKDNNIKYVALNTLNDVIAIDFKAVSR